MMKRSILLTVVIVFVFALGVSANDQVYYWDFIDSADIQYAVNEGLIEYLCFPYDTYNDGFNQFGEVSYGIFDNTQIYSYIELDKYIYTFGGNVKYKFYDQNNLTAAVQLYAKLLSSDFDNYFILGPKALITSKISDNFELYNNVQIDLLTTNDSYSTDTDIQTNLYLENGFSYEFMPGHLLKAKLDSAMYDLDFDLLQVILSAAYQTKPMDKLTYTLYCDYSIIDDTVLRALDSGDIDLHITNAVKVEPMQDITLTGAFKYNSLSSNGISITGEKAINQDLKVKSEFFTWFATNNTGITIGVQYKI